MRIIGPSNDWYRRVQPITETAPGKEKKKEPSEYVEDVKQAKENAKRNKGYDDGKGRIIDIEV